MRQISYEIDPDIAEHLNTPLLRDFNDFVANARDSMVPPFVEDKAKPVTKGVPNGFVKEHYIGNLLLQYTCTLEGTDEEMMVEETVTANGKPLAESQAAKRIDLEQECATGSLSYHYELQGARDELQRALTSDVTYSIPKASTTQALFKGRCIAGIGEWDYTFSELESNGFSAEEAEYLKAQAKEFLVRNKQEVFSVSFDQSFLVLRDYILTLGPSQVYGEMSPNEAHIEPEIVIRMDTFSDYFTVRRRTPAVDGARPIRGLVETLLVDGRNIVEFVQEEDHLREADIEQVFGRTDFLPFCKKRLVDGVFPSMEFPEHASGYNPQLYILGEVGKEFCDARIESIEDRYGVEDKLDSVSREEADLLVANIPRPFVLVEDAAIDWYISDGEDTRFSVTLFGEPVEPRNGVSLMGVAEMNYLINRPDSVDGRLHFTRVTFKNYTRLFEEHCALVAELMEQDELNDIEEDTRRMLERYFGGQSVTSNVELLQDIFARIPQHSIEDRVLINPYDFVLNKDIYKRCPMDRREGDNKEDVWIMESNMIGVHGLETADAPEYKPDGKGGLVRTRLMPPGKTNPLNIVKAWARKLNPDSKGLVQMLTGDRLEGQFRYDLLNRLHNE